MPEPGSVSVQGDVVPLTDEVRRAMAAGMDAALAVAAEAEARGQAGNGCVIVDPGTGEIVASGGDNSVAHPLKWATENDGLCRHPYVGNPDKSSTDIDILARTQ
jgi:hypothetical protein